MDFASKLESLRVVGSSSYADVSDEALEVCGSEQAMNVTQLTDAQRNCCKA